MLRIVEMIVNCSKTTDLHGRTSGGQKADRLGVKRLICFLNLSILIDREAIQLEVGETP